MLDAPGSGDRRHAGREPRVLLPPLCHCHHSDHRSPFSPSHPQNPHHIIGVVSSSVYAFSSLDLFLLRLIQSVPAAFTKQYPFALSFALDSSSP